MAILNDPLQFLNKLQNALDNNTEVLSEQAAERMKVLAGVAKKADAKDIVIISFDANLLLEYQKLKQFKKSSNKYYEHPADPNIPVERHFHVMDVKGNNELYAVNFSGTAHHQRNKGVEISKREADELRAMGVQLRGNMLESINIEAIDPAGYVIIVLDDDDENKNEEKPPVLKG